MREARVLATHAARPGFTSRGFARTGTYDRLAARVPAGARTLDLACGDGALLARLPGAVGVDVSPAELALASPTLPTICARAQALPFAAASFDVVTCHLALMLFDELPQVIAELARVLRPGGSLLAVLGGGPVASPADDDGFPHFLALLGATTSAHGDRPPRSEAAWRALFAGWTVAPWQRDELVLDGSFDEVWAFLAASYELPDDPAPLRAALARELPHAQLRCRAVTWLLHATR